MLFKVEDLRRLRRFSTRLPIEMWRKSARKNTAPRLWGWEKRNIHRDKLVIIVLSLVQLSEANSTFRQTARF